jgi:hypothetical protein
LFSRKSIYSLLFILISSLLSSALCPSVLSLSPWFYLHVCLSFVIICRHSISMFLSFFIFSPTSFLSCCQAVVTSLMLFLSAHWFFSADLFTAFSCQTPVTLSCYTANTSSMQTKLLMLCTKECIIFPTILARQWKYISLKKSMHLKTSPLKSAAILREAFLSYIRTNGVYFIWKEKCS